MAKCCDDIRGKLEEIISNLEGIEIVNNLAAKSTPIAPGPVCANGGTKVEIGIDTDNDGVPNTIQATFNLCTGIDGTDGKSIAIQIQGEPAGVNCAEGGVKITVGTDTNDDGVPDADLSVGYVCGFTGPPGAQGDQGDQGEDGEDGISAAAICEPEPEGENCEFGGFKFTTGQDLDKDGIPDANISICYSCSGGVTAGTEAAIVKVSKNTNQPLSLIGSQNVIWEVEQKDTNNFWSPVPGPEKITVTELAGDYQGNVFLSFENLIIGAVIECFVARNDVERVAADSFTVSAVSQTVDMNFVVTNVAVGDFFKVIVGVGSGEISMDDTYFSLYKIASKGGDASPTNLKRQILFTVDSASADGSLASPTPMTLTPNGSEVVVFLNGRAFQVGDGVKTLAFYLSNDGGVTARTFLAASPGDLLYVNPSLFGYTPWVLTKVDELILRIVA